jgi:SAM-dependent methyltransferase
MSHGELLRDRGSFRDPGNRVFDAPDGVYRALSADAAADWRALAASALADDPRVVRTEELEADAPEPWTALLRHERVPFVSYPYEWPFSMLKRAALLQLDLLADALAEGLILKDGTPYNVLWDGARPVFIDIGSFERYRDGTTWEGYRQFCQLHLYPLMLTAWKGVPYQPWLRGALDGITPTQMRDLLSFRDRFRRGATTHVFLHARLERRYADRAGEVKSELRKAGFGKDLVLANTRKLRRIVDGLEWRGASDAWGDYTSTRTYSDADAARKAEFVSAAVAATSPQLVWDLGCNDGTYAKLAAAAGANVVATDSDHHVIDRLAREENERILPLVVDLADPSPSLGWRGAERRHLPARGRPDLIFALALVHHLAITRNIPLDELCDWLVGVGGALVVEFVDPEDEMARRLLAAKREGLHGDYTRAGFEQLLDERYDVERIEELAGGRRVLFLANPR